MAMVNIKGLNKGEVLAALYNYSHRPRSILRIFDIDEFFPMKKSHGEYLLKKQTYFNCLEGRVLKVDLSGDEFDSTLYDRENGQGAAQKIIDRCRTRMVKVLLPSQAEIMERLRKINMESVDYMSEVFFLSIAYENRKMFCAQSIVLMLILKISNFLKGERVAPAKYTPTLEMIFHGHVPEIIDALIDNREVAIEAKRIYKEGIVWDL